MFLYENYKSFHAVDLKRAHTQYDELKTCLLKKEKDNVSGKECEKISNPSQIVSLLSVSVRIKLYSVMQAENFGKMKFFSCVVRNFPRALNIDFTTEGFFFFFDNL